MALQKQMCLYAGELSKDATGTSGMTASLAQMEGSSSVLLQIRTNHVVTPALPGRTTRSPLMAKTSMQSAHAPLTP